MPLHPPVLILGMHRSGTSCLTGCLEEAGLYLGDVNTEAGFNKKGNRENRSIMEHHDRILARVGASWDNPPPSAPVWTQGEKDQLTALLIDYESTGMWGVKDPRALFMLDGWRALTSPRFVGTFRHPREVAASLVYRAGAWKQPMEMDKAYQLWADYNTRLLTVHAEQPFDIIRYDVDPAIYNNKLIAMSKRLGLNPEEMNSFREEGLYNQHKTDETVPPALKSIWEALNDLAV